MVTVEETSLGFNFFVMELQIEGTRALVLRLAPAAPLSAVRLINVVPVLATSHHPDYETLRDQILREDVSRLLPAGLTLAA